MGFKFHHTRAQIVVLFIGYQISGAHCHPTARCSGALNLRIKFSGFRWWYLLVDHTTFILVSVASVRICVLVDKRT